MKIKIGITAVALLGVVWLVWKTKKSIRTLEVDPDDFFEDLKKKKNERRRQAYGEPSQESLESLKNHFEGR